MAFYILQPPSFLNVHRSSWITFSKAQKCSAKSSKCAGLWLCVTSPIHTALSNAVQFLRRLLLKHWTKMLYPQSLSSHKRPVASLPSHNCGDGRTCFRSKRRRDQERKHIAAYPSFHTHAKKSYSIL